MSQLTETEIAMNDLEVVNHAGARPEVMLMGLARLFAAMHRDQMKQMKELIKEVRGLRGKTSVS